MAANNSSLAAFEHKLFSAQPELEVIGVFLSEAQRTLLTVYGCLVHELEQAVFAIREPQVAAEKLQWWGEELGRAVAGRAQHPITQALFAIQGVGMQPASMWQMLLNGALVQLNCDAPSDLAAQLLKLGHFYRPVTYVEMALLSTVPSIAALEPVKEGAGADTAARVAACIHLLRCVKALIVVKTTDALLFPLNLLARHHKTAADFTRPLSLWRGLLNDYLDELANTLEADLSRVKNLSVPRKVQARLALAEIRYWRNAVNPEHLIGKRTFRASWACVWYAWREARTAHFQGNS